MTSTVGTMDDIKFFDPKTSDEEHSINELVEVE